MAGCVLSSTEAETGAGAKGLRSCGKRCEPTPEAAVTHAPWAEGDGAAADTPMKRSSAQAARKAAGGIVVAEEERGKRGREKHNKEKR